MERDQQGGRAKFLLELRDLGQPQSSMPIPPHLWRWRQTIRHVSFSGSPRRLEGLLLPRMSAL